MDSKHVIASPSASDCISVIGHIKFTLREIEILAALLHRRGASKIATLLSISTRTVETHTENIRRKIGVNSREGIIDFIEKSGQRQQLTKNYQTLLTRCEFKKKLEAISKIIRHQNYFCFFVFEEELSTCRDFILALKEDLHRCGFSVKSNEVKGSVSITQAVTSCDYPPMARVIYLTPDRFIEEFYQNNKDRKSEIVNLRKKYFDKLHSLTFLIVDADTTPVPKDLLSIGCIKVSTWVDYENFFLRVLAILIPEGEIGKKVYQAIQSHTSLDDSSSNLLYRPMSEPQTEKKNHPILQKSTLMKGLLYIILGLSSYSILNHRSHFIFRWDQDLPAIRSELIVPAEKIFLERPDIFLKLEACLQGSSKQEIGTVALVGIGGAGKTIMARKYAHQQKLPIVWEINADTSENLKDSFERLAYSLCQTESEHQFLSGLQNIKNRIERDEKMLLFVKEKLKSRGPWLLIYDNVNKFSDIQRYFPRDSRVWGKGKVIITTADSNNNAFINNFIQIGELTSDEKFNLFTKFLENERGSKLSPFQRQQIVEFLTHIPPFPLDVSIAACYIKYTHTPYPKYLEKIKENSKDFESVQSNVVKEASGYNKTRRSIVSLSVQSLIEENPEFKELLLLISLLDSQNIPQDLLSNCKTEVTVDNFIYHLRKYSLVNDEPSNHSIPVISVHRGTQENILNYLTNTLDLEKNSFLNQVTTALEKKIVDALNKEDFATMKLLAPHCETFLKHGSLLNEQDKAVIEGALGCIYYYLKNNLKSKQLLEDSLEKLERDLERNHERVAYIRVYLGNFCRHSGNLERAKELLEQSLKIYNDYPNDLRKAKSLGYLGVIHRDLGNYKIAKELLEESLSIHKRYLENQVGHAWILSHLGNVYTILGDYQKAKNLLEQSAEIYKKQSGNSVGLSWSLEHLGRVYRLLGDYDKAEELLNQSLEIIKQYFTDEHIYVASCLCSLADVFMDKGNYKKAEEHLKTSLMIYQKEYGKIHFETGRVLRMFGEVRCKEDDLELAEHYLKESLLILQEKKSVEIYHTYEVLNDLYLKKSTQALMEGDPQKSQVLKKQARRYLQYAFDTIKNCYPSDSQHIKRISTKMDSFSS